MIKRLISSYQATSLYALNPQKIADHGFKTVLMDLDNTLASVKEISPTRRCYELIEAYYKAGIDVVLISNNHPKRVKTYAEKLRVNYLAHAAKPLPFRVDSYLRKKGIRKSTTLLIGDQVINDMYLAHFLKIEGLLTQPLSPYDHISTRLIRPLDRFLRRVYTSENRLGVFLDKEN